MVAASFQLAQKADQREARQAPFYLSTVREISGVAVLPLVFHGPLRRLSIGITASSFAAWLLWV